MSRHDRILALLAGTALAFALSGAVSAYGDQTVATLTIAGPGVTAACGGPVSFRATALDADLQPITGQPIAWSVTGTPTAPDVVNATPTNTNVNGVASTTITFACVPGSRTVTAIGDVISASTVLSVGDGAVEGTTSGGLPSTSTLPDAAPTGSFPIANILAFAALLIGAGMIARRLLVVPR